MTFRAKPILPAHTRGVVRWSGRLLLVLGMLALGYVGFTVLDARTFQASAQRSIEAQIQVAKERRVSLVTPSARPTVEPAVRPPVTKGDVLGIMDIPRLGLSVAVLQGTSSRTLRLGAGHIEGTALPGEVGNIAIAGHRDTFFRDLRDIRPQDEIQLQTATALFRYEVDLVEVVDPDDVSVLAPSTASGLSGTRAPDSAADAARPRMSNSAQTLRWQTAGLTRHRQLF
jgi:sortase A